MNIKTERDVEQELDRMLLEVKEIKEADGEAQPPTYDFIIAEPLNTDNVTITQTVRELKREKSYTFKAKLQVDKKRYALRQTSWYYGQDYETEPSKDNLAKSWYLTNGTMKSIIKNHPEHFICRLTSYFDGMIDCTQSVEDPQFHRPSKKLVEKLLEDLGSRGYMRVHYYPETGIFKCYSCCDSYDFALTGVDIKFL